MKKAGWIAVIALSALFYGSCRSKSNNNSADSAKDTTANIPAKKDTTSITGNTVDKIDTGFVFAAASGGMTEVELGKIAQQHGASNLVKKFGAMMVTDHSKVNDTLSALATKKGIILPNAPTATNQASVDKLMKLTGSDFDKAYVNEMISDHKNDIKAFEYASNKCPDRDIRAFAHKTLPILKNHLQNIEKIHGAIK